MNIFDEEVICHHIVSLAHDETILELFFTNKCFNRVISPMNFPSFKRNFIRNNPSRYGAEVYTNAKCLRMIYESNRDDLLDYYDKNILVALEYGRVEDITHLDDLLLIEAFESCIKSSNEELWEIVHTEIEKRNIKLDYKLCILYATNGYIPQLKFLLSKLKSNIDLDHIGITNYVHDILEQENKVRFSSFIIATQYDNIPNKLIVDALSVLSNKDFTEYLSSFNDEELNLLLDNNILTDIRKIGMGNLYTFISRIIGFDLREDALDELYYLSIMDGNIECFNLLNKHKPHEPCIDVLMTSCDIDFFKILLEKYDYYDFEGIDPLSIGKLDILYILRRETVLEIMRFLSLCDEHKRRLLSKRYR